MTSRASTIHPLQRRTAIAALVISVVSVAVAWGANSLRMFRLLHLKTGDAHALFAPAQRPDNIVLVVIDQQTLDTLPEPLLFWHHHYARAIDAAARTGARVLGLDVSFAIPVSRWVPGYDEALTQAVVNASRTMPVICVASPGMQNRQQDWPVPMNIAAAALSQIADPSLRAGEDDFVRSVDLHSSEGLKSFALAVAEKSGYPLRVPDQSPMLIRYAGPAGAVTRIPFNSFLDAAQRNDTDQLRRWVGDKIVLVGADILSDRHATPYYAFRAGQPANTAGVEIHASAVWNLLRGNYLRHPGVAWVLVFMTAAALFGALSGMLYSPFRMAVSALVIVGLSFAICQILYSSGWTLPASVPLLSWAVAAPLGILWMRGQETRARQRLHEAVSVYASPQVAQSALEGGAARLPGRRVRAAILFTDIRDFTRYSEAVPPEQVFTRLNEYFEASAAVIRRHNGQVVQLTGDGMLAIFSMDMASDRVADTIRIASAVRAAQQIVDDGTLFSTRAGIHVGDVVIGGVGSGDKMEYTALGDAVNIAARLEALNKECGTSLLLSEEAHVLLRSKLETRLIGSYLLKGRSGPQNVYTVA